MKCLFSNMYSLVMLFQMSWLRKWHWTFFANKWPVLWMSYLVFPQSTRQIKCFGTLFTKELLFFCMDFNVGLKATCLQKCLCAFIACKWFPLRTFMCCHVGSKVAQQRKWFVTMVTGIWFLSSMNSEMYLEGVVSRKRFRTMFTGKCILSMNFKMFL